MNRRSFSDTAGYVELILDSQFSRNGRRSFLELVMCGASLINSLLLNKLVLNGILLKNKETS